MRVTLSVTGHRVLAERERVAAGVDRALDAVERAYPGRPPLLLSALAEGADRLVAARLLARPGAALHAVLPLPLADYAADFPTARSRHELDRLLARAERVVELPPCATRQAAYQAAGDYLLERSEVLVAVWDGAPPEGCGGTGGVVARARARGLPIAWIRAGNRRPGTAVATTLGAAQGRLTLEGF